MMVTYVTDGPEFKETFTIEIVTEDPCWVSRQEIVDYMESLLKDLGEGWGYFTSGGSIVKDPVDGGTL